MHQITFRGGSCLAAAAAFLISPGSAPANPPGSKSAGVVATQNGLLSGVTAGGVRVFKGIPFAAPPVGLLRWRPPRPAANWHGVRTASLWGAACPQPTLPNANHVPADQRSSEDCLYLNVWTPAATVRRAPVMVWTHGGGFIAGGGSFPEFDGSRFARDGVVLVTLNYRLGLLGFFAHPALTAEASAQAPLGNYGLMDQIAALEWVKRNIGAFGGDPKNVTLFGESSGATSVVHLLTAPAARGLFQKVIIQSAPGFAPEKSLVAAESDGERLAASAGAPPGATAAELRALPLDKLIAAGATTNVAPFVDGRLIVQPPMRAMARGAEMRVPMIIGSNSDEGSLVDEGLRDAPRLIASFLSPAQAATARQVYDVTSIGDPRFGRESFGDLIFGSSARWIAAQQSAGAPTYLYRYEYVWRASRGHVPGASHAAEMLMVFNTLDQHHGQVSAEDWSEARLIHDCWVNFAKSGVPLCRSTPKWVAYNSMSDKLMDFGSDRSSIKVAYRKAEFDFWQPVGLSLSGASAAR